MNKPKLAPILTWRVPSLSTFKAVFLRVQLALSHCDLCSLPCQTQSLLCDLCLADLPIIDFNECQGDLLNHPKIFSGFKQHYFDRLICVGKYQWPFDQWISQLKYQRRFELSDTLAKLMTRQWLSSTELLTHIEQPVVVPVPLHWLRTRLRTFNQAELLAQAFATQCQLPINTNLISRIRYTKTQVGQKGKVRRLNLRKAFAINDKTTTIPDQVILIDDVITTGTTVNEIARLLKKHGVQTVTVLTIAISTS